MLDPISGSVAFMWRLVAPNSRGSCLHHASPHGLMSRFVNIILFLSEDAESPPLLWPAPVLHLPPHARERKKNHLDVAGIEPGRPGKQATMPFITPRLSLKAQSSNMATLVHLYRDYRELVTDIRACRENLLPSSHHPLYEFPSALNSDA